jgi:hypothetical protein
VQAAPEFRHFSIDMIVEVVRKIVRVEIVYIFTEGVYDCRITPSEIESTEFDFFSFAASAESSENSIASKKIFYRFWQKMREHRLGQKALRETVTKLLIIVTTFTVEKNSKIAYFLKTTMQCWWAGPDLNRRPSARQADVLPS